MREEGIDGTSFVKNIAGGREGEKSPQIGSLVLGLGDSELLGKGRKNRS